VSTTGERFPPAGRFEAPERLDDGLQRIAGLADAPGGIAYVEVTVDGSPAGRARTALPGTLAGGSGWPESPLAGFEMTLDIPHDRSVTTLAGTAHPLDGPPFPLPPVDVAVRRRAPREEDRPPAPLRASGPPPAPSPRSPVVLVVTHDLGLGGAQLYLHELLTRLHRRGLGAAVVTFRDGRLSASLEEIGVPVLEVAGFDAQDPDSYEATVRRIADFAVAHECTVALGNTALAFPGIDAAQRLGLSAAWVIHESFSLDQLWLELYGGLVSDHVVRSAERTLRLAQRVVFVAEATKAVHQGLTSEGASVVVPYGVDLEDVESYTRTHDRDAVRRRLGFSDSSLVLLCLGMVEPRKAQIALTQAFAGSEVLAGSDVALALVGAGPGSPYLACLRGYLDALRETRVTVVPVQADTRPWHFAADVFVCASDIESLPRSILEAMAFSTPVISTDTFGVPELVVDGETGYLCRTRDTGALREMLERTARTDPDRLRAMGRAAHEHVLRRHDPSIYEDYFVAELTRLAAGPRRTT
jgi:glycosyltransferase involved in cell wall biosynthesis